MPESVTQTSLYPVAISSDADVHHAFAATMRALEVWLGPWHLGRKVAIGVSGGPDSLALCYLWKQWAGQRIPMVAYCVNHNLQEDSLRVSLWTQELLRSWGIEARILTWEHPQGKPASGILEKARQERYALLSQACKDEGIDCLLCAHHWDDVLETLWMRHGRHSGWRGLAGISALTPCHGILLCRPLLTWKKHQLVTLLREKSIPWIEDPANKRFLRGRAREALSGSSSNSTTNSMACPALRHEDILLRARVRHRHSLDLSRMYRFWRWENRDIYGLSFFVPPTSLDDHQGAHILQTIGEALAHTRKTLPKRGAFSIYIHLWRALKHPSARAHTLAGFLWRHGPLDKSTQDIVSLIRKDSDLMASIHTTWLIKPEHRTLQGRHYVAHGVGLKGLQSNNNSTTLTLYCPFWEKNSATPGVEMLTRDRYSSFYPFFLPAHFENTIFPIFGAYNRAIC